jgi:hypothetical protein
MQKIKAGGAVADKARAQLYLGSLFYMATAPLRLLWSWQR